MASQQNLVLVHEKDEQKLNSLTDYLHVNDYNFEIIPYNETLATSVEKPALVIYVKSLNGCAGMKVVETTRRSSQTPLREPRSFTAVHTQDVSIKDQKLRDKLMSQLSMEELSLAVNPTLPHESVRPEQNRAAEQLQTSDRLSSVNSRIEVIQSTGPSEALAAKFGQRYSPKIREKIELEKLSRSDPYFFCPIEKRYKLRRTLNVTGEVDELVVTGQVGTDDESSGESEDSEHEHTLDISENDWLHDKDGQASPTWPDLSMSSVSFPRFSTPHPNHQFPSSPEPKKRSPQIVTFKDEPAIIPNHKTFVHDLSEVDVKESPVLQPVSSVPSKYLKMATPNAQEVPLTNWGDRGHKARVITVTTPTSTKNGHVESRTSPLSHYSPEELKRIAPSIKMERFVEEVSSVPISLTVVRGSAYSVRQPPFHQPISSPASRSNNSNGKLFTKASPTNGFFGRGKLLNGFGQNHSQKQQVEPQMTKGSNGLLDDDKPCIVEYEDGTVQVLN